MKPTYIRLLRSALIGILLCAVGQPALAQEFMQQYCVPSEAADPQALHINGAKPFIYKTVDDVALRLHVFNSAARRPGEKAPAVIFYFGGGWIIGDIRRFQTQATHLALRGIVTILVDYRVKCRHGSSMMDSVADAKSAMRWVHEHAGDFGIDTKRIAAVGSSAGAHLALATALYPDAVTATKKQQMDSRPNALILYNPALDTSSPEVVQNIARYVGREDAERGRAFSPIEHLDKGLPPTIIFQGTADTSTPSKKAEIFCEQAKKRGAPCEVVLYPGAPHGFTEIWMGLEDPAVGVKAEYWAADTSRRTDAFLAALGWLPGDENSASDTAAPCECAAPRYGH